MKDAAFPSKGAPPVVGDSSRRLKKAAAIAAVSVAAILICAKAVAYFATGSVSLLSTLVDSLLDLAASMINLIAIRHAVQPADQEHRFGHGKAEPLAGLGQAAFIAGSAVFVLVQAGERLVQRQPLSNEAIGIGVMVLSIVLTLGLVLFQRTVVQRTGSLAIGADALHYRSDLLANLGVIGALLASTQLGWGLADPLFAIAVAIFILFSAWRIFSESFNLLMDRELPDEDRAEDQDHRVGAPFGDEHPRSAHAFVRHAGVYPVPSRVGRESHANRRACDRGLGDAGCRARLSRRGGVNSPGPIRNCGNAREV